MMTKVSNSTEVLVKKFLNDEGTPIPEVKEDIG